MSQKSLEQIVDGWEEGVKTMELSINAEPVTLTDAEILILSGATVALESCIKEIREYQSSVLKNSQADVKGE